jgi:hypothetical protein
VLTYLVWFWNLCAFLLGILYPISINRRGLLKKITHRPPWLYSYYNHWYLSVQDRQNTTPTVTICTYLYRAGTVLSSCPTIVIICTYCTTGWAEYWPAGWVPLYPWVCWWLVLGLPPLPRGRLERGHWGEWYYLDLGSFGYNTLSSKHEWKTLPPYSLASFSGNVFWT